MLVYAGQRLVSVAVRADSRVASDMLAVWLCSLY